MKSSLRAVYAATVSVGALGACSTTSTSQGGDASTPDTGVLDASVPQDGSGPDGADAGIPDAVVGGDASSPFPTTPGASIWFDAVDEVVLVHNRGPVGPPLFLTDGGALPDPCPDTNGVRTAETFTFTQATREIVWEATCGPAGDGATAPGKNVDRVLTTAEADTFVSALTAVVVAAPSQPASDGDHATVTTHVGAGSWTYRDQQGTGDTPNDTVVQKLADALAVAHALGSAP